MFRRPSTQLAQTDNASEAVSAEVDDSSECFDDATETTQENGRPHKTRSVSFLLYNVGSVASKLYDCDWVKYVELFDFVTLTETFMDNDFDLSGVFHDFIKFVCPAVKLSYHGRRSGGLLVMEKKQLDSWKESVWTVTMLLCSSSLGPYSALKRTVYFCLHTCRPEVVDFMSLQSQTASSRKLNNAFVNC